MGNGGGGSEIARSGLNRKGEYSGLPDDAPFKARAKEGYSLATGAQAGRYTVPGIGSKSDPQIFKAKVAADEDPSWIAGKLGLSEQQRQANFNANALRDAKAAQRDLHGPGDDPMIYREEKRKKEEAAAAAAAAAKKAEEDAKATKKATDTTPIVDTTATTTDTKTTAVNTQATDYSKLLNDMQAKYDAQLSAFQSEMDAATQKQADQLTKLTEATTAHKKKLKKKRKYGRLSLLFGSELGLPETTTLGTGTG